MYVRLAWWTLFAAAFGYTEATVVIYLRQMLNMPPGLDYPGVWHSHHLAFSSSAFDSFFADKGLLAQETRREIATILLLLGASLAAGKSVRERIGLFLYSFAVWDLTYYLFLAPYRFFPSGLGSTDVYFLVPFAWFGPVWFPVLIVMPLLLIASIWLLIPAKRTSVHRPRTQTRAHSA